jgi:undecaprenyl diphosphate synthase
VSAASAPVQAHGGGVTGDLPRHVAIIMDGNGRWAKKRLLPRVVGHRKGVEAARAVVEQSRRRNVEVLTLYAFSAENWRRPADEVNDLMGLLRHFIT